MVSFGNLLHLLSVLAVLLQILGVINAAHAVMNVRSSRGAIAWSISLLTIPWLATPLYWVLGRNRFHGYAEALQAAYSEHKTQVQQVYQQILKYSADLPPALESFQSLAHTLTTVPFTFGNQVALLLDGKETFTAMLSAIAQATDYILLQTYILEDDATGNTFRQALIQQAKQGVRVYLLYDGIGTRLPRSYLRSLQRSGVQVKVFKSSKGKGNRWQINFRNHRKILIVDGTIGFVGGLNIGDEYCGRKPPLSPWRDTHLQLKGPAVQCLQGSFLGDWFWATRTIPKISSAVQPALANHQTDNQTVLVFPTGPADRLPACSLFFVNAINQAQHRLWIASPYFVPDESVSTALKLAANRGVDVRILLPSRPDHWIVYICSFSYYGEMQASGVKLYRYQPGFMHQKVILIDEAIAGVGTVNLDNRSFFLNFEVTLFVSTQPFVTEVERMLERDLEDCQFVAHRENEKLPLAVRLPARVARLFAPVL